MAWLRSFLKQLTHSIPHGEVLRLGDLWVIAKPAGLASHGSANLDDNLLKWCRREHGASKELAPINRLDRATSGLVLASECSKTRARLGDSFAKHEVRKRYLALVHGRVASELSIERPLLDRRRGKKLDAVTHVRLRATLGKMSFVDVSPITGRKHQIRRHLRGVNHAIVGDARYGKSTLPPHAPERLWLHCESMTFPDGLQLLTPLPGELVEHLRAIGYAALPVT